MVPATTTRMFENNAPRDNQTRSRADRGKRHPPHHRGRSAAERISPRRQQYTVVAIRFRLSALECPEQVIESCAS